MARTPKDESQEGALERLRKWLTREGVPAQDAHGLIERIDRFHSGIFAVLHSVATVGISVRTKEDGGFETRLHLLWPDEVAAPAERTILAQQIGAAFASTVTAPDGARLRAHLDLVDEIPQEDDALFIGLLGMTADEEAAASRLVRELQQIDPTLKAVLRHLG